jgi:hypothetical protein
MSKQRKQYGAEFKFQVALEAAKNGKTVLRQSQSSTWS